MRLIVYTLIFFNILTFALSFTQQESAPQSGVKLSGKALDIVEVPAVNDWETPVAPVVPDASFPANEDLAANFNRDVAEANEQILIAQGQVPANYTPAKVVTQLHYRLADYCLYVGPFEQNDIEAVVRNLTLNGILADIETVEIAKEVVETKSYWRVLINTTVPENIITLVQSSDLVQELSVIKAKTDFDDIVTISAGVFSNKANAEELNRELERISINSLIEHVELPIEGSERVLVVEKSYLRLNRNNTTTFEQAVDRELFVRLFDVNDGNSEDYVRVFRSDKCAV